MRSVQRSPTASSAAASGVGLSGICPCWHTKWGVYSHLQFASDIPGGVRMAVQDLQDTIAEAAAWVGPPWWGSAGLGPRIGVVIGAGQVLTAAQNLRREELTVVFADGGRETAAPGGVDPDLGLAVLSVLTGDTGGDLGTAASPHRRGGGALRTPAVAACARRLGFVSAEARSFRGPRGRRVRGAI